MFVISGFLLVLAGTTWVTARWSSARARRRMTLLGARVAEVPSIATRGATTTSVLLQASRPTAEARIFFLDVYREQRSRSCSASVASPGKDPTAIPTLSYEHPRPARGA